MSIFIEKEPVKCYTDNKAINGFNRQSMIAELNLMFSVGA